MVRDKTTITRSQLTILMLVLLFAAILLVALIALFKLQFSKPS
jgi:hypothetical protein